MKPRVLDLGTSTPLLDSVTLHPGYGWESIESNTLVVGLRIALTNSYDCEKVMRQSSISTIRVINPVPSCVVVLKKRVRVLPCRKILEASRN